MNGRVKLKVAHRALSVECELRAIIFLRVAMAFLPNSDTERPFSLPFSQILFYD